MKIPYKKMAHIPVYTVGFHSSAKSHKSEVYKWVNICCVSYIPHRPEICFEITLVTTLKLPITFFQSQQKTRSCIWHYAYLHRLLLKVDICIYKTIA